MFTTKFRTLLEFQENKGIYQTFVCIASQIDCRLHLLSAKIHLKRHSARTACEVSAPMHIELAPGRREAVSVSGRGPAVIRGRKLGPDHGGGVEREKVVKRFSCALSRGREGTRTQMGMRERALGRELVVSEW